MRSGIRKQTDLLVKGESGQKLPENGPYFTNFGCFLQFTQLFGGYVCFLGMTFVKWLYSNKLTLYFEDYDCIFSGSMALIDRDSFHFQDFTIFYGFQQKSSTFSRANSS